MGQRRLFVPCRQSFEKLFRFAQSKSVGEYRYSSEDALLFRRQEIVTPLDRAPERALAGRQITGTACQELERGCFVPAFQLGQ